MILKQLSLKLEAFSPKQRKIAEYLLSHYDKAAFMTAEELAEASSVSQPTVVRFAQYMGYERYKEFQEALRIAMRDRMTQAERLQRSRKLVQSKTMFRTFVNSMRFDMKAIEKTISNLQEENVRKAAGLILDARRVYVIASHAEYGVATYFASTLGWVKENTILIDNDFNPAFDTMADASSEDVAIAYSFPPYPARTVNFFRALKRKGANCIAVTDSDLSPLAKTADYAFIAHDEKLFFSDNIAAAVSLFSAFLAVISSFSLPALNERMAVRQEFWKSINFYNTETDAEKGGKA